MNDAAALAQLAQAALGREGDAARLRSARAIPPARAPSCSSPLLGVSGRLPSGSRSIGQRSSLSSAVARLRRCARASARSSAVSAATHCVRGQRLALDRDAADLALAKALDALAVDAQLVGAAAELDLHAAHVLLAAAQAGPRRGAPRARARAAPARAWQRAPRPRSRRSVPSARRPAAARSKVSSSVMQWRLPLLGEPRPSHMAGVGLGVCGRGGPPELPSRTGYGRSRLCADPAREARVIRSHTSGSDQWVSAAGRACCRRR